MIQKETDVQVFLQAVNLAKQMEILDDYIESIKDRVLIEFLEDQKLPFYCEIAARFLSDGNKSVDFGNFEPLIDRIICYLKIIAKNDQNPANTLKSKKPQPEIIKKLKTIINFQNDIKVILNFSSEYGTDWLPLEIKKAVRYAVVALPIMITIYETLRVTIIATLAQSNINEISKYIYIFYLLSLIIASAEEQKNLKNNQEIVFNPYTTIMALLVIPPIASLMARIPKAIGEIGLLLGMAASLENHQLLSNSILAAISTSILWNMLDASSNIISRNKKIVLLFIERKLYANLHRKP